MARAALPLRTRLDSASAIAPAVGRRYRPMNSELLQQEPDRWLLAHLLATPSRSTRHRQGEWSRVARISGGRACVGRTNDRTTRSSAPLHAGRRAERALPLPAGGRKKCARLENLRVPLFFRTDELQSAHSTDVLPTVMAVRATVVYFTPVAHRGLAVRTSRAAVRCQVPKIVSSVMIVPKMQQAK